MKIRLICVFILIFFISSFVRAEDNCKNLKACAEWATSRTGLKYDLGKLEKRSLKIEKDFSLNDGDADFLFNFIIQSNEMVRLKRENGNYQIINIREMKDFQFPTAKLDEIPATLDYYLVEFSLANKDRVANAKIILKKILGKEAKLLEVTDSPKLQVIETGLQLQAIKSMISELNR